MYMYCETMPCEIMCSRTSLGTPFAWPLQTSGQRLGGETMPTGRKALATHSRIDCAQSAPTTRWLGWNSSSTNKTTGEIGC